VLALGVHGKGQSEIINYLRGMTSDRNEYPEVRARACLALAKASPNHPEDHAILVCRLDDEEVRVRIGAAEALWS
jgi:hypothetical protein